jgi:hypothetical protein
MAQVFKRDGHTSALAGEIKEILGVSGFLSLREEVSRGP